MQDTDIGGYEAAARYLDKYKRESAKCLLEPVIGLKRWSDEIETLGLADVIEADFVPPVDYLINYLGKGDVTWRDFYLARLLEQLHCPYETEDSPDHRRNKVLDDTRDGLIRILTPLIDAGELSAFEQKLNAIHDVIRLRGEQADVVKVLLIGDCLLEGIVSFLNVPLLEQGIGLRVEYATSKNTAAMLKDLRKHAEKKFDAVFFSPYSTEFNPFVGDVFLNPNPFVSSKKLAQMAGDGHESTSAILRQLAASFECPIFVQDTNLIRHNNGTMAEIAKTAITWRSRNQVARRVNTLARTLIGELNRDRPRPIVVIEETKLRQTYGELTLGRRFYDSDKHHPLVLAEKLSATYRQIILAVKALSTRKVVVVDLDDTLWKGTIGEGAVEHLAYRQEILRQLKAKGVLLAIASKNDPEKVHWTGAVLDEGDFVAARINWQHKAVNIQEMAAELNLKVKDFVFIDDRADQRELVKSAIPEIHTLDATDEAAWERLRWWADFLPHQTGPDRTQMYHERKEREAFLQDEAPGFDQNALFAKLGLKIDLHRARRGELERVTELINRTNQFNTLGSRTNLQQVTALSESGDSHVVVCEASDKFGAMGIVSAMVLERKGQTLSVGSWVLSCRVFGYGFETAMLNYARSLGQAAGCSVISGRIVETPNNAPCREVFADNGFVLSDGVWSAPIQAGDSDPSWLTIVTEAA